MQDGTNKQHCDCSRIKHEFISDTPHYENEVPFEVPKSWEWTSVESFTYDLQYGTSEKSSSEGDVPVLRMGNITRIGTVDFTDLVYSSNKDDIEKFALVKNDLLFNRTNSSEWVGKTAIFKSDSPAIYAGYLIRVRCILVCPDYVNFVLNSSYHRDWCNLVKTDAVNQSNINAQKLSKHLIPIPPYEEQLRIVAGTNKWMSVIDKMEDNVTDFEHVISKAKSKILDLAIHGKLVPQDPNDEPAIELLKRINPKFTPCDNAQYENIPFGIPDSWEWVTLGSISNYGQCKNIDVSNIPPNAWVLELEDIEKDSANIVQHLSCKEREINGVRHSFQKGNVLYSKLRTYLNKVLVAPEDGYCTTEIVPIAFPESIMPNYINHVLRSNHFLNYASQCVYGVKMPRLSTSDACKGLIPLPPYKEQLRIVAKIEELFGVFDNITKSLES